MEHPRVIQGGMGVAVSGWPLARAVASRGAMGVVSGTALETVLIRRLQDGDSGGHVRRSLARFPIPRIAESCVEKYYVEGGKDPETPYALAPKATIPLRRDHEELLILANFVEVDLAREGHDGAVGINYLEKVRMPHLPSLLGAMLAGVDYVLMGAGIPREIPGILDAFAAGRVARMTVPIESEGDRETLEMELDPLDSLAHRGRGLKRPFFLAIVSSFALAKSLSRRATGKVDGFVIEGPTAGGHNAPPRGQLRLDSRGEPIYGERDQVDLEDFVKLGAPFWIAGSCADAEVLRDVLDLGGNGVQIGTAFALCRESGLDPALRASILDGIARDDLDVRADPRASPTGFPFRIVQLDESLAAGALYEKRRRVCDLGYLRSAYRREDGRVGFRCSAEPVSGFLRKGGKASEVAGRKCLCNGLMANIGMGQYRESTGLELPLVTTGSDYRMVKAFIEAKGADYSAADVLEALLADEVVEKDRAAAAG